MDRKETLNKVLEYIKLLNESGLLIDKAYLFGSAARNEQHEGSDIDVMLVSKRFDDQYGRHCFRIDLEINPQSR